MDKNNNATEQSGSHRPFVERRAHEHDLKTLDVGIGTLLDRVLEINELLVELKAEVGVIKTDLHEHKEEHTAEKVHYEDTLNKLINKITELEEIKQGFIIIDGKRDYVGHHEYHKSEIKSGESWDKIKETAKNKVTEHLVTFLIAIMTLGGFAYIQHGLPNQTDKLEEQVDMLRDTVINSLKEKIKMEQELEKHSKAKKN